MARPRLLPDNFTLALLGAVAIATLLPARGQGVVVFEWITNLAIGLLFFMHGAKLSGSAILAGMGHWRLHLWCSAARSCCSRCSAWRCARC